MNEAIVLPRRFESLFFKRVVLAIAIVGLAFGVAAIAQSRQGTARVPENYVLPRSQEIEEKFGVRFTFLAVTAKGGFADLRYRVIDAGKAANFGHYTETSPMVVVERSGEVVDVTFMGAHNHRVEPGRVYYVLFRNTSNAIRRGDLVTIAIGDLKLEHVIAQ